MSPLDEPRRHRVRFDVNAAGMAIATVNGQRLVAAPIRQDQVDDAISEIVETIGGPTDIEVTHPDGTLESHRLTAHTSSDTGSGGSASCTPCQQCRPPPGARPPRGTRQHGRSVRPMDAGEREQLVTQMDRLSAGLERIAQDYRRHVDYHEEDPETFGAGHFVFYPRDETSPRWAIEEQYTDTDWSDPDRVPSS